MSQPTTQEYAIAQFLRSIDKSLHKDPLVVETVSSIRNATNVQQIVDALYRVGYDNNRITQFIVRLPRSENLYRYTLHNDVLYTKKSNKGLTKDIHNEKIVDKLKRYKEYDKALKKLPPELRKGPGFVIGSGAKYVIGAGASHVIGQNGSADRVIGSGASRIVGGI